MNSTVAFHRLGQRAADGRVFGQGAVFRVARDPRQALVDNAARSKVHVAHLGIAHLTFRQAHGQAGGVEQGARVLRPEPVPDRGVGVGDGVVVGRFPIAPAIHDNQGCGLAFITHA